MTDTIGGTMRVAINSRDEAKRAKVDLVTYYGTGWRLGVMII